ncbi:MAG: hypothetical protein KatS3mg054_0060 [Chloroflexus sp.]|nr:MAG: hypothetical protein KatS3mg054_0060 [Chloroflexus sp.]
MENGMGIMRKGIALTGFVVMSVAGWSQQQTYQADHPYVVTLEGYTSLLLDNPLYPRIVGQSRDSIETATDVTTYLQQAVDKAAVTGGIVKLKPGWYKITGTINVPEGVTIEGTPGKFGVYAVPFQDWYSSGTVIYFDPIDSFIPAFRFYGTLSNGRESKIGGMRDLTIMGSNTKNGVTAILVDGNGHMLSSGTFRNVHIHGFRNGHGLHLRAQNGGAVTYFTFDQMRFRDCDTSIHLQAYATGSGNFVNSNIFYNTVISGGNLDYGILAETMSVGNPNADCNHNQFYGGSIEPQYTSKGHVVVLRDAWIVMKDVRIEATQQFAFYPQTRPIYIDSTSIDNVLDIFATVEVDNRSPNSIIKTRSPKNNYPSTPSANRMVNTNFTNLYIQGDSIWQLPGYSLGIANFTSSLYTTTLPDSIYMATEMSSNLAAQNNVLVVGVPKGKKIRIWQQPFTEWTDRLGQYFTVGCWVKADVAKSAQWIYTYNRGGSVATIGSEFHYKVGEWAYIGGTFQNYTDNESFVVYLTAFNDPANNIDTNFVRFTQPTFVWGQEVSLDGSNWLNKSGGKMDGVLALNSYMNFDIDDPAWIDTVVGTSRLYLPTNANVFRLRASQSRQITSINVAVGASAHNDNVKYFPGGTELTLIIDSFQYIRINNSAYIRLTNGEDFVPKLPGGWIKLVNDPVAVNVWYEVGRGTVETNYGTVSMDYSNPEYHDLGNNLRMAIPYKSNYVVLTNAGSGTVQYISQVTGVRKPGEIICIENASGNTLRLDYPFVETKNKEDYVLPNGEKVFLMATEVNGVYTELSRTQDPGANWGSVSIDMTVNNEGSVNYMLIPWGYHFVKLTNAPGPIQRINQAAQNRRPAGDIIAIRNETGAAVTFQEPFILMNIGITSSTLRNNEVIVLLSNGDGIWTEIGRYGGVSDKVRKVEQYLLEDMDTLSHIQHYVLHESYIAGVERYKEGFIYAAMDPGKSVADILVYLGTSNLHKGMELSWTVEDADGTNRIGLHQVTWNYNAAGVASTLVSQTTSTGTYNGVDPQIVKSGSYVAIRLAVPSENNVYRIRYKLL